jgi:cytochrome c peroxidase
MGKDADVQRFTPFMAGKVEPMMGELLHMTVFDPETKTGELSCETCHTLVDETGKVVPPKGGHKHDHDEHAH